MVGLGLCILFDFSIDLYGWADGSDRVDYDAETGTRLEWVGTRNSLKATRLNNMKSGSRNRNEITWMGGHETTLWQVAKEPKFRYRKAFDKHDGTVKRGCASCKMEAGGPGGSSVPKTATSTSTVFFGSKLRWFHDCDESLSMGLMAPLARHTARLDFVKCR